MLAAPSISPSPSSSYFLASDRLISASPRSPFITPSLIGLKRSRSLYGSLSGTPRANKRICDIQGSVRLIRSKSSPNGMTPSGGVPLSTKAVFAKDMTMEDANNNIPSASSRSYSSTEAVAHILKPPIHIDSTAMPPCRRSSPVLTSSPDAGPSNLRNVSPPNFPPFRTMKRSHPNVKKLALSLSLPPANLSSASPVPASAICPSPVASYSTQSCNVSADNTPFTPGPPKTPALAMNVGRGYGGSASKKPSVLSLNTQTPTLGIEVPTPSGNDAYIPTHQRRRSNTSDEPIGSVREFPRPRHARSAYPTLNIPGPKKSVPESTANLSSLAYALPNSSSSPPKATNGPFINTDGSSSDGSSSRYTFTFSTPDSTPPAPAIGDNDDKECSFRLNEPYQNGPIEIIPNVFLGAEDSVFHWPRWTRGASRVRVINVAQEIENPFVHPTPMPHDLHHGLEGPTSRKGKNRVSVNTYPALQGEDRPEVLYAHLQWSHGEQGLANLDGSHSLCDVLRPHASAGESQEDVDTWKFWEAIVWMEEGRLRGEPILIHCQCGVSRSATLMIAYIMALAAAGVVPEYLGKIGGMQDAYGYVKAKSSWVGPNVSLVFQLVEFARNLTTLLTRYLKVDASIRSRTGFPTAEEAAVSEDEWAKQRAAFETDPEDPADIESVDVITPEAVRDEAEMLDQAMLERKKGRSAGTGMKVVLRVVC